MKSLPTISALTIVLLFLLVLPASAGYVWETVTVDASGNVRGHVSLAFDTDGTPAISYQYVEDPNMILKYAWLDGGVWQSTIVHPSSGSYTSLAFNGSTPAISYCDDDNTSLKYAWMEGGVWQNTTVDNNGDVGQYTSLAFNGTVPAISYYDNDNTSLKYAWLEGGVWQNTTVDNNGSVGQYTSLAFNGSTPAISYYDVINGNLKYAWLEGGVWQNTTVDATIDDVGLFNSLAFDSGGNPAISYSDFSNLELKYAWLEGGVWRNTTIDGSFLVQRATSLAFNPDDSPVISYYHSPIGYLKVAWKNASGWQTATIDDSGIFRGDTSLAFNGSIPAIAYWDEALKLKYATGTPVGTITVTSAPAGAAVLLDGVDTGFTTPATLVDVPVGTHNVTVTHAGYFPGVNNTVEVIFDETTDVAFTLSPVPTPTTPTPTPTPDTDDGDDPLDDTGIAVAKGLAAGGNATLTLDPSLSPVYAIEVTVKGSVATLLVTARTTGSPASGIPLPDGIVYQFCEVTLAKATDDQVDHAEMMFTVPMTWLEANGLTPANIVLSRWHDGEWQQLPTTFVKEEGGKAYFTATTPGFSLFAIVAVDEEEETPVPTEEPTAEMTATDTTVSPTAVTTGTEEETPAAEETAGPESTDTPLSPLVVALGAVVGTLLVLDVHLRERKE